MKLVLAAVLACAACTTLGPMPATTAISAVPAGRPSLSMQGAIVPAFYLSDSAAQHTQGQPTDQLAILLEPDRLLGMPGLIVGIRNFGQATDSVFEPYLGYRAHVSDGVSLAAIGYGTAASASHGGATYSAARLGAELAADVRLLEVGGWVSVHWQVSGALTHLEAAGSYCVDPKGAGIDCVNDGTDTRVSGNIDSAFPSGTVQLSLDVGHRPTGIFHDVRLALLASAGNMPVLSFGRDEGTRATYTSWGLSLEFGLGAER
jgi:hypothetical protein